MHSTASPTLLWTTCRPAVRRTVVTGLHIIMLRSVACVRLQCKSVFRRYTQAKIKFAVLFLGSMSHKIQLSVYIAEFF
jgi:hypothetical protein